MSDNALHKTLEAIFEDLERGPAGSFLVLNQDNLQTQRCERFAVVATGETAKLVQALLKLGGLLD